MGNLLNNQINPELLNELNEQTDFTETEINKFYGEFIKDYPDGFIRFDEYKKKFFGKQPVSDKYAEHLFKSIDLNKDDKIDFKEFLTSISITSTRENFEDKIRFLFKIFDIDQDGYISLAEIIEMLSVMRNVIQSIIKDDKNNDYKSPGKITDEIFRKMDKNNDNLISLNEFIKAAKSDPKILFKLRFIE
jgi:Ca2+-binding EF-hand superfamily protein